MGKHRTWTAEEVDKIILLKFGRPVDSQFNRSYMSNAELAKLFKCSSTKVRQLYMKRFAEKTGQD